MARAIGWTIVLCLLLPSWGQSAESVEKQFEMSVQAYLAIQKDIESALPSPTTTKDTQEIVDHQHDLASRIAAVRPNAHQGDVFTREVSEQFLKIIRKAFKEPGGRAMRATLHEDGPVKSIVLHVNAVYPEENQRVTTPPTLLDRLPSLPKELSYRIIGRALVLQDMKTNMIIDFVPDALP